MPSAGELFLARDRLGVKPLYYAQLGDRLVFASEIKAMLPALPPPSLRREAVLDYLTFLWVPDPDTLFEGVWKLPPGTLRGLPRRDAVGARSTGT